jgi:hypothetical protein
MAASSRTRLEERKFAIGLQLDERVEEWKEPL